MMQLSRLAALKQSIKHGWMVFGSGYLLVLLLECYGMLSSYIEIQMRSSLLVYCSCTWCTTGLWLVKSCSLVKHFRRFTESKVLSCKWQLTFLSQRSKRGTTRKERWMKKRAKEMLNIGTWNLNTQQSQMFLFLEISLSKLMTTKSLLSLAHQAVVRLH